MQPAPRAAVLVSDHLKLELHVRSAPPALPLPPRPPPRHAYRPAPEFPKHQAYSHHSSPANEPPPPPPVRRRPAARSLRFRARRLELEPLSFPLPRRRTHPPRRRRDG